MEVNATTSLEPGVVNGVANGVVSAPWLCGDNWPLWNTSLTWYTSEPSLTPCFRQALWTFPPAILFWLLLPLDLNTCWRSSARGIPLSFLGLAKFLVTLVLAALALMDLCYFGLGSNVRPIQVIEPSLRLLCFATLIAVLFFERARGVRVSSFQWFFFGLFVITSILVSYDHLENLIKLSDPSTLFPSVTFVLNLFLLLLSFSLHFFAEPEPTYKGPGFQAQNEPCPKINASFPSQLLFSWFTGLAWTGFKRALTVDDLWDLSPSLMSKNVVPRFSRVWDAVSSSVNFNRISNTNGDSAKFNKVNDNVEIKDGINEKTDIPAKPYVSVFPTLVKAFGGSFTRGSLLKGLNDVMIFINPFILKLIINYTGSTEPLWKGIFFATLLLITASVQTVVLSQYFFKMYMVGLWVRTSLISAIYRKSLKVSTFSKKDTTTGEVVNLMSVDVQRLVDMMPYLNMLWSAPLQIALSIFFLWQQLGPSVLAGLLLMILLIPMNGVIAAKAKTLQVAQMKEKDERVKIMNEILQGIKILKLYAWEPSFEKVVTDIRTKEIGIMTRMAYLQSGTSFIWSCAPFVVSLVTFATFVLVDDNNILTSEKAFVSLSLFNILRFPLSMLPMMIMGFVQAGVSVKRINKFMNAEEIDPESVEKPGTSSANESSIRIEHGSFTWDREQEEPTLQDINLEVKRGQMIAVVGTVGSGKSSLMSAILGEIEKLDGNVSISGKVAYVAQQAWIQNATVKNNILFSQELNQNRYDSIIESCALTSDIEMLPGGDKTEVGEKGINLSGGQKHRLSLARAVYADADVYLLDDPLSAVDAHVGKHIFENVFGPKGQLSQKTRLLVTHGITYLKQMDRIVVMREGRISESGSYEDLLAKKGDFAEFLVQFLQEEGDCDDEEIIGLKDTLEAAMGTEALKETMARVKHESECRDRSVSISSNISGKSGEVSGTPNGLQRGISISSTTSRESSPKKPLHGKTSLPPVGEEEELTKKKNNTNAAPASQNKQYQDEKVETGKVDAKVYIYYIKNMGIQLFGVCIFSFVLYQVCSAGSSIWLSEWSDTASLGNQTRSERDMYLGVYGALGVGQALAAVSGSLFLYFSTLNGAKKLHHLVLSNILKSPMSFFDTTPGGRILNRFGKDIDVLDTTMPMILRGWITCLLAVLSTFAIISYTTPIFMLPIGIILVAYYIVQRIYVATSRELKRLESVSRSPIYSHFQETVNGVQTIRAYNLQDHFIAQSEYKVDENQRAGFPSIVSNRWLAVRLEFVGNLIIFCAALFSVLGRDSLTPGLVGLSISYALSVTQTLNWLVRMTSEVETNIVAAERLKEYAEVPTEAKWTIEETQPPADWPVEGTIEFQSYSTRYRDNLPLVLKEVSFEVEGGKRVGIVGRTGAGKSSLTLALFRLIEKSGGKILIDGIDISDLGLHQLRSKLTIIPQDPVLFSGTMRSNLDPFNVYSDDDVWRALQQSHLKDFITGLPDGLEHKIVESGENLSVGQRQLVCLARALLRKTKILVLDEATAAVDMETDDLIQDTIQKEFAGCTIITIAHRLNTIIDYDKILVLSEGTKAEFDSPKALLAQKTIFYDMCKEAGLTG